MPRTVPAAKGRLRAVAPAGATLAFQFDPEKLLHDPGIGGWTTVPRDGDTSAVEWTGNPPAQVPLTLWFDGFDTETSVEPQLALIEAWGGQGPDRTPPPVLQLLYGGMVNRRWVLNGVQYLTEERRADGARIQTSLTLTLLEHIGVGGRPTSADSVRSNAFAPNLPGTAAVANRTRTYTVKAGDTLNKISAKVLGSAKRWTDIAKLNPVPPLRDPGVKLKAGRKLRLPTS